jgi:pimeloyl-ACP methyl ester carboxylesterase
MPEQMTPFAAGSAPVLHGETAGEGPAVVLCHGITATRRSVVHGSRGLERAGHTVVSYDARGHGESDPAPAGQGYGYSELVADLEAVIAESLGERSLVLAGHSMGAHTATAYALSNPERLSGLVLIGPAYVGGASDDALRYWDGLAAALQRGGVDGFVAYIDEHQPLAPRWRDSVLRFTRERMSRHRHPEALVEALRQVARSRPFAALSDLEAIDTPTLVVASHDEADPGHPHEAAEAYASRIPNARLISETAGESPLAWQGGKLSREIAAFCAGLEGR